MKKQYLSLILSSLCYSFAMPALSGGHPSEQALKAEAKGVIQALASSLGKTLKATARDKGLPAAIAVCNTQAGPLTQQVSEAENWQISRTSLKLRNPGNAPDHWEKSVLDWFEKQAAQGADLKTLAYSEVVTDASGQQQFRMMKAIPVGQPCLACHGEQLQAEIEAELNRLYPGDKARGFQTGDLRGAFSLSKTL